MVSGGWVGSARRVELPLNWDQIRTAVLLRDRHRCQWLTNGTRCGVPARQVDHIVPGSDHSLRNLRALCDDHHAAKSSAEGNAARWAHRAARPAEQHPGLL